jgi:hypothetical protein
VSLHVQEGKQESSVSLCLPLFEAFLTACCFISNIEWTNKNGLDMQFVYKKKCNLSTLLNNSFKLESYQAK